MGQAKRQRDAARQTTLGDLVRSEPATRLAPVAVVPAATNGVGRLAALVVQLEAAEDAAEDLAGWVEVRDLVEREVANGAAALRADGHTWKAIGQVLGVTRQAAHKRHAGG